MNRIGQDSCLPPALGMFDDIARVIAARSARNARLGSSAPAAAVKISLSGVDADGQIVEIGCRKGWCQARE
jgi:hypothetical protein